MSAIMDYVIAQQDSEFQLKGTPMLSKAKEFENLIEIGSITPLEAILAGMRWMRRQCMDDVEDTGE